MKYVCEDCGQRDMYTPFCKCGGRGDQQLDDEPDRGDATAEELERYKDFEEKENVY